MTVRIALLSMFLGIFVLLFISCPGEIEVLPGDPDYIPPDWSDPILYYDEAAYFPSEVTDFRQAPGQYANDATYGIDGNTDLLLGTPVGAGTAMAGNTSIVSLGMAGGYVEIKFEPPILDHADNIGGYDFIVFGNSIWPAGNPESAWQEPGAIWVMKDTNGDGSQSGETWYLIPGSHLTASDSAETIIFDDTDGGLPPPAEYKASWWPAGETSPMSFPEVFTLPGTLYSSAGAPEAVWGYVDVTPTMTLGDLSGADGSDGDNSIEDEEDYPGISSVFFYTTPDTPGDRKIDPGSGGGDAIDIAWAVDPADFSSAGLDEISWIKIVSATAATGTVGEYSCEVDAVARVRRSN